VIFPTHSVEKIPLFLHRHATPAVACGRGVVAVEVLVEEQQVAPLLVSLEQLCPAVDRSPFIVSSLKGADESAGQLLGYCEQGHRLTRSGGALDGEIVPVVQVVLQPTIDDLVEVTGPGTLYVVDQGAGTIQTIDTSGFAPGTIVVAQPLDSGNSGQLGVLDPVTGVITHFSNTFNSPKGLLFVPGERGHEGDQD
jgi:hypothetical protein